MQIEYYHKNRLVEKFTSNDIKSNNPQVPQEGHTMSFLVKSNNYKFDSCLALKDGMLKSVLEFVLTKINFFSASQSVKFTVSQVIHDYEQEKVTVHLK
jgi:hypothetical protein